MFNGKHVLRVSLFYFVFALILSSGFFAALVKADGYFFVSKWGSYGADIGQFDFPYDVAIDGSDYVYVTDDGNFRVQKFTSAGTFVSSWGSSGSGDGQFHNPHGIAIDGSGYVYVTDWQGTVQKFTSDGVFLAKWSHGFAGAGGIAIDSSGYIYITDYYNCRVQKFTSTGTFVSAWGNNGTGNGQFNGPGDVAVDGSGYVYVTEDFGCRVQKFTSAGTFVSSWGSSGSGDGQFNRPAGIAVDGSGYIIVCDGFNNRIQKFTPDGVFVSKWGSFGSGDGQFITPLGVAVDSSGYVYVSEAGARVQKFGCTRYERVCHFPFENKTYVVTLTSNSTLSEAVFNQSLKQIEFNVTGADGINGFCNTSIPADLMSGTFSIFKDDILLTKDVNYTQTYNGTHYTFQIFYNHSTHTIRITSSEVIPEFPPIIMILMVITVLSVALFFKRKLRNQDYIKNPICLTGHRSDKAILD